MRGLVAACLLVAGCIPGLESMGDGGTDGADTGLPTSGADSGSAGTTTTSGSDSGGSETGTFIPVGPYDCKTQLQEDPASTDGVYEFRPGGDTNALPFRTWCDMTTDGGGWTLVGRSVLDSDVSEWGWYSPNGAPDDDMTAFSVDAYQARLTFSELLVGSYVDGKTWGDNVYKLAVPEQFLFLHRNAPVELVPTTLIGDCSPSGGPLALRQWGYAERTSRFFLDDAADYDSGAGLNDAGFDLPNGDCDLHGNLDGAQGMIFVR